MMVVIATEQVGEQQYAIKYILSKCILWFNMYDNLIKSMEHIKFNKHIYLMLFPKFYHKFS